MGAKPYPSLELRRAAYGNGSPDYTRDGTTEVGYLFANGVRLARLVNRPNQSDPPPDTGGDLRVFFELGDHLGSTSAALDKETGELVERATYQAYGGKESDYRPGRWGDFREDYGFTGKEEDVEVGLVYFGKRFYNPLLQRWVSADPLEVHSPLSADANIYAYVRSAVLMAIDPLGLDSCGKNQSCVDIEGEETSYDDEAVSAAEAQENEFRYTSLPGGVESETGETYETDAVALHQQALESRFYEKLQVGAAGLVLAVGCAATEGVACASVAAGMIAGSQSEEEAAFWAGGLGGGGVGRATGKEAAAVVREGVEDGLSSTAAAGVAVKTGDSVANSILGAHPKALLSRQGAREMDAVQVQEMAEDMMVDRFSWARSGPIQVAERDGVQIIIDGHHRAAAAVEAGLQDVPIVVREVSDTQWQQLFIEVVEAAER